MRTRDPGIAARHVAMQLLQERHRAQAAAPHLSRAKRTCEAVDSSAHTQTQRTDKRRGVQLLGVRGAKRDPNALERRHVAIAKPSRQER